MGSGEHWCRSNAPIPGHREPRRCRSASGPRRSTASIASSPRASAQRSSTRCAAFPSFWAATVSARSPPSGRRLGIAVDQRVIFAVGAQRAGTYAERVNLPARCVCPIAPTLSDEDAAGLGYAGTIAVKALDVLGIRTRRARGRRLLIHGASTGVGAIAIQLARSRGAKVTGLCPSESHTWVRSLGASETVESGDAQAIGNLRADAVLRCTPPFADDPLQDTLVGTLVRDGVDPSYACVWPQLRALCGEPGWLRGALGGVESLARRVRFSRVRHHWVWFNEGSDSLRDVGAFFATADAQPVTGCRFALAALPTIFNDPAAVLPTARGKTCFTI
jgi:hypothetical protein